MKVRQQYCFLTVHIVGNAGKIEFKLENQILDENTHEKKQEYFHEQFSESFISQATS